jgi:hypothetical protein
VISAAERLAQQDISKIWLDTYQRRMLNREKFWNGNFATLHYEQIKNKIIIKNA